MVFEKALLAFVVLQVKRRAIGRIGKQDTYIGVLEMQKIRTLDIQSSILAETII